MPNPGLLLVLLLTLGLSLTGSLLNFRSTFEAAGQRSGDALTRLLGDGRRMFSYHFYKKADAYFHRGNYPSIFEEAAKEEDHMTEGAHSEPHEGETPEEHAKHSGEGGAAGDKDAPDDWIARLNRRLKPSQHVHLEGGAEREMLPWLKLSAELDPHRIETYTVAAYWLRTRLGKTDEAEQFLREGLRENPNSYEILYELGRLTEQNRKDLNHARTLYELALGRWEKLEKGKTEPDNRLLDYILAALAKVEEQIGDLPKAIEHLERLKGISPNAEAIQHQIDDLRSRGK